MFVYHLSELSTKSVSSDQLPFKCKPHFHFIQSHVCVAVSEIGPSVKAYQDGVFVAEKTFGDSREERLYINLRTDPGLLIEPSRVFLGLDMSVDSHVGYDRFR